MICDDLQNVDNAQNVYVVTLIAKIFQMMIIFVVDFDLKTRQLNVINVFLNAFNDEAMYCHISNKYKKFEKMFKIIRTLYDKKKRFYCDCEFESINISNSN